LGDDVGCATVFPAIGAVFALVFALVFAPVTKPVFSSAAGAGSPDSVVAADAYGMSHPFSWGSHGLSWLKPCATRGCGICPCWRSARCLG